MEKVSSIGCLGFNENQWWVVKWVDLHPHLSDCIYAEGLQEYNEIMKYV